MADMTKADWDLKDLRIVRQSCLKCATEMVMGLGASGLDKFTLQNVVKRTQEAAQKLVDWVYENEDPHFAPKPFAPNEPKATPTLKQKKLLEAIAKKLNKSYSWVLGNCDVIGLPNNEKEAKELYVKLKG